jgi:NAD(P)-dependent dehydrogenase (short-subunit alcohol dehydrogenase family)
MKKNILITGASGNVGRAVSEKFLSEAWQVLATTSPGKNLGIPNASFFSYEVDLSNEKSSSEVVGRIIAEHRSIDAAVLTVGGFATGNIQTTEGAAIQKMIELNFNTAYFMARPIFNQMVLQEKGRIVFVGARPALQAQEGKQTVAYALSKTLIFKLSEILNAEAGEKNIVSSVIVPSTIDTPANRKANPTANFLNWVAPQEIANAIYFLASDAGRTLRETVLKLYSNS